jgi:hypothetical protein
MSTVVAAAAQAVIVTTFVVSVWNKVRTRWEYAEFRDSLPDNLGIPRPAAGTVARATVAAEALAALVLAAGTTTAAWLPAVVVLAALTFALGRMIRRGAHRSCHCFGRSDRPPGRLDLVRNTTLLAIAIGGGAIGLDQPSLIASVVGVVIALVLINVEDVIALARPLPVNGHCMEETP